MSCKAKIAAAAATFALAGGGLGLLGTLSASAATPKCGPNCQDLYSQKFGPGYLLAVFRSMNWANQEIILREAADSHPTEDFVIKDLGSVGSYYGHHPRLISPQFDIRYSPLSAYELQYEPYGIKSDYCVGTWPSQVAHAGFEVRLEPCGRYRNTVWAVFSGQFAGDHTTPGYDVLISAATDSLSDPLVLNYPAGRPAERPTPELNVQPLHGYANGTILDNQQWAYRNGPVM
ncbi:MAG: hypothetical protein ACLPKE_35585 [Streptosporangiaceae bacterium]